MAGQRVYSPAPGLSVCAAWGTAPGPEPAVVDPGDPVMIGGETLHVVSNGLGGSPRETVHLSVLSGGRVD